MSTKREPGSDWPKSVLRTAMETSTRTRETSRPYNSVGPAERLADTTSPSNIGSGDHRKTDIGLPRELTQISNPFIPPQTRFNLCDIDSGKTVSFERLQKLHSGLGRVETPLDEVKLGYRRDYDLWDKQRRIGTVLSEFPEHVSRQVYSLSWKVELKAYSSHYAGLTGFAIGGAMYVLAENREEALDGDSVRGWIEEVARPLCQEHRIDYRNLIELTFDKLGDGDD